MLADCLVVAAVLLHALSNLSQPFTGDWVFACVSKSAIVAENITVFVFVPIWSAIIDSVDVIVKPVTTDNDIFWVCSCIEE